jgi:asparagine synthase (glutamine-hydrolysing)
MCGIAAILGQPAAPEAIEAMVSALRHRGPDGQRTQRLDGADLGHARLAVLDILAGGQPMSSADGACWIVFNGEIYNHDELRQELLKAGHDFRTRSDTEVLLHAWLAWGEQALTRLNGQFAFLIWDAGKRQAFAARDRVGEKPLYFAEDAAGRLLVASEIKALLATGLLEPRLNRAAAECMLACLYVPPGRTIYANVAALSPGEALRWRNGRLERWSWWQPPLGRAGGPSLDMREAASQLRDLLDKAVARQLVADVPVGAFLSGGLDSTSIVALAAGRHDGPLLTFSAGFADLIDELPFARDAAALYGTEHHELQMDLPIADLLEQMADIYDEPFADSSNLPTFALSRFARSHVKVVLSGDGADELFGGYSWYAPLLASDGRRCCGAERALLWGAWRVTAALAKLGLPLQKRRQAAYDAYRDCRMRGRTAEPWMQHLLRSTALGIDRTTLWGAPPPNVSNVLESFRPPTGLSPVDQAVFVDMNLYLPGDILCKVDRAAMAVGLETRAPFLDSMLLDWVCSLPPAIRFGAGKPLLRAAMQQSWPESVRKRGKQGFGAPILAWLQRGDIRSLITRVTRHDGPLAMLLPGLPGHLERLSGQALWSVLCLGLWLERRPGLRMSEDSIC